jgi:CubicO group peptidase (beta-lactamase class C family)
VEVRFMHALLLALLARGPIDAAVQIVMRSQHVAGISLGVARGATVVYARGYGERDVMRGLPAQPQTVYRIGSLTKMFTARAILNLAARGAVSLDLPAARYVPQFPWDSTVTVRDLLAQRSGIPSYTDGEALNPYAWYAPAQLIGAVAQERLAFPPGTQFAYSNTNYVLLGMIAESVTRTPFEDFLNERVVAPLGLPGTRYGDRSGEAVGYKWNGTVFIAATPSSPAYAFSAAAMTSDVPDMLRFLATMRAPYYGMMQSEVLGSSIWYASGNVDGYSAFAFIVPQTQYEAVMLCNADRVDLAPLALDVLAALPSGTSGSGFGPAQNEDPRITAQVKDRVNAMYAPIRVTLVEFLGRETRDASTAVVYRVTLSNGTRINVSAPILANGTLGKLSITPL